MTIFQSNKNPSENTVFKNVHIFFYYYLILIMFLTSLSPNFDKCIDSNHNEELFNGEK